MKIYRKLEEWILEDIKTARTGQTNKTGDGFKKNILISAQFGKKKAEKEFHQKDISMQGCINAATFFIPYCWYCFHRVINAQRKNDRSSNKKSKWSMSP